MRPSNGFKRAVVASCAAAAGALLMGCASPTGAVTSARGPAVDEYVQEAQSRVLLRTPPGSRPVFENLERHDVGTMIFVCGAVRLQPEETLPFLVMWKRHEPLSEAIVAVELFQGETPKTQPWLGQQRLFIEEGCKGARLQSGQVAPPSPSPPNITPEQYVTAARAKVLERIRNLRGAQILSAVYGKAADGAVAVCGTVKAEDQTLPFAATWDAEDPLDEGGLGIAVLGGATPAQNPEFEVFSKTVRSHCRHFGLGGVVD